MQKAHVFRCSFTLDIRSFSFHLGIVSFHRICTELKKIINTLKSRSESYLTVSLPKPHLWPTISISASLVTQRLKRLPAMRDTWVRSLGWEDPLEKEMATHSSILAWRIPWTEEPGGLQSTGLQRVGHDWAISLSLSLSFIGEGNGNPLQCSCLENPRDDGAWWAAVYGVTESDTTEAT